MLTTEQREILPNWTAYELAEIDRLLGYGYRDITLETRQQFLVALANALLALKEAQEVLKEIEWIEGGPEDEDKFCPECGQWKWKGHLPNCKIAKNLPEVE